MALDEPFPGGITLPGGKEKCGFVCSASELQQVCCAVLRCPGVSCMS